jgi:hypothetical protein
MQTDITTSNEIGYVQTAGTNNDGSYRNVERSIFSTTAHGKYEVYSASNADHHEISRIMAKREMVATYDRVFLHGKTYYG